MMGARRVARVAYEPTEEALQPKWRIDRDRREFYRTLFPWCWCCENARSECVHEMARGIHRDKAFKERFAWWSTCSACNCELLTDYAIWPLARQLAGKWINDREYFNLLAFNRLRGLADGAITMTEVILHICRLLDGKDNRGRF